MSESKQPLLKLENVKKYYPIKGGLLQRVQGYVKAVENVSLDVFAGESIGIVGESGCGKSTLGRTILGLEEATDGSIFFEARKLAVCRNGSANDGKKRCRWYSKTRTPR